MRRKDKDGGHILRESQHLIEKLYPVITLVMLIATPFIIRRIYFEWRQK